MPPLPSNFGDNECEDDILLWKIVSHTLNTKELSKLNFEPFESKLRLSLDERFLRNSRTAFNPEYFILINYMTFEFKQMLTQKRYIASLKKEDQEIHPYA